MRGGCKLDFHKINEYALKIGYYICQQSVMVLSFTRIKIVTYTPWLPSASINLQTSQSNVHKSCY